MMLSTSHRSTGQGSTAVGLPYLLPLRTLTLLLVIAIFSPIPGAAAGRNQIARPQNARYSGCNVANMQGSCQTIHRPDYIRRLDGGPLVLQPYQCRSMIDFLRCSLYKMACRRGSNVISKVPCQSSCEHAVNYCKKLALDAAIWNYLNINDCKFLPAGGCLDWTNTNRRRTPGVAIDNNEFCRQKAPISTCAAMFPRKFKRRHWRSGNYSIAVDILIKSVIWYFRNRPTSYFTAEVKRVYKSNIGLEKGVQKLISWPLPCYCPGQILVGHRYYLLSHSIRHDHEVNMTVESVFLPKIRRYRRRFPCWIDRRCPRKRRRNGGRRRRRRSVNKRRRFRYS